MSPRPHRSPPVLVVLVALVIASQLLAAQGPIGPIELVHDVNQVGFERDGSPHGFVRCGNEWFFVATTFDERNEIWKTDGTAAGTSMVVDFAPGQASANPRSLICLGSIVYAATSNGLLRTDGTAAGTSIVQSGHCPELFEWNGALLFSAGNTLYLSDGTANGTVALFSGVSSAQHFAADQAGTVVYFSGRDQAGDEPWRTDGTAAGTFRLKDIRPGTGLVASSQPEQFVALGGGMMFRANDGIHGVELWRTDGTSAGTNLLADLDPGSGWSLPQLHPDRGPPAVLGGQLFFRASDGVANRLMRTDGTAAGTSVIPLPMMTDVRLMLLDGATLYLAGTQPSTGTELYRLVGNTVSLVADIHPGVGDSDPSGLTAMPGGSFLLSADDGSGGPELWHTDGTAAGTLRVREIVPGATGGSPLELTPTGNGLTALFRADDPREGQGGSELWITDGTSAGTQLLFDCNPGFQTEDAYPGQLFGSTTGALYFAAYQPATGFELWVHDGGQTSLLADLQPGAGGSAPTTFVDLRRGAATVTLFVADDGTNGREVWRTDGTPAGTILLRDIRPGAATSDPRDLVAFDGRVFFTADGGQDGRELWVTDGTAAGTMQFADINPGGASSHARPYCVAGGKLFFTALHWHDGHELWATDGTVAGTYQVHDLQPGAAPAPGSVTAFGDEVLFYARHPSLGTELFRSDGTSAGTTLVEDLVPGPGNGNPSGFTAFAGEMWFTAGSGLWKTDGTAAGTIQIASLAVTAGTLNVSNDRLFFVAPGPGGGRELFASDGTAAGTGLVADIRPGSGASDPLLLTPASGGVFFRADDGTHGKELWFSDGTAAGTVLVADLDPGAAIGHVTDLLAHRGGVWFPAFEPLKGVELRVIRGRATVDRLGNGCGHVDPPTLRAGHPVLGGAIPVRGTVPTGNVSALVIGLVTGPIALPGVLPADCVSWPHLLRPTASVLQFGPQWSYALNIPASSTFTGVRFTVQTVHASTPISVSNGLVMTLGG